MKFGFLVVIVSPEIYYVFWHKNGKIRVVSETYHFVQEIILFDGNKLYI